MTPVACIYHKDCIDGTTAAAVVLRKFPQAQFFPVGHSHAAEELAEIFPQINPSADLYIVDTTHGVERGLAQGNRVTVLDHHISEHERVAALVQENPNLEYIFDNTKSGASLAWSYFFSDEPIPQLIAHVEDIDLWLQKFGDQTEHVANYLSLIRNDPAAISALLSADIETIYEKGALLTQNMRMEVKRFVELDPIILSFGEYTAPAFNITNYQSQCGNELATTRNEAVAMYTIRGDIVRFSFRSLDGHTPSALDLAQVFGGGGHRNAAGGTMPLIDFIKNIHI